jgi:hypothetical protein
MGTECPFLSGKRSNEHADEVLFHTRLPSGLQEWGWDCKRCVKAIRDAGLAVPMKSA